LRSPTTVATEPITSTIARPTRASSEKITSASGMATRTATVIQPTTGWTFEEREGTGGIQREKLGMV
jgi:hypothetical protein